MPEQQTVEKVLIVLRQIIRAIDLHSKRLVQDHGLTGPQLVVLKALGHEGPISVGELANQVSLSQATVTGVLDRLELRGLVRRSRSTADKRRVMVVMQPGGQEILAKQPSLLQEQFIARFVKLDDWEQTLILSSLQRVAQMMKAKDLEAEGILEAEPLAAVAKQAVDVIHQQPFVSPPPGEKRAESSEEH